MHGQLTVATLNIWNRCGPWATRLAGIRAGVRALAPDLLGLQEVVAEPPGDEALDQAALIAEGLGYQVAFGRAPRDVGYPFGNAALSRWPIARSDVFPLPRGGTEEYRSLLFTEIDAPFGKVPFFVTHLNWKLHEGSVRELQVREIVDRIKALAPLDGFPPILVGDFNAEPDSDEMRFMRGLCALGGRSVYFSDAFHVAGDGSKGATFARRNPFAAYAHEPDRRIDYIYTRGPDARFRGEATHARVCFDEEHEGSFPSDHFGVIAKLTTG